MNIQKIINIIGISAVLIGGIAYAAITPIPTISNTFAVNGSIIHSTDINKLAQAINILDSRTNGTPPIDPNNLTDKEYVDSLAGWTNIVLTDTNDFSLACEYRAFQSDRTLYSSQVKTAYIDFIADDSADGVTDTIRIVKGLKGSSVTYWWFDGPQSSGPTANIIQLQKKCQ